MGKVAISLTLATGEVITDESQIKASGHDEHGPKRIPLSEIVVGRHGERKIWKGRAATLFSPPSKEGVAYDKQSLKKAMRLQSIIIANCAAHLNTHPVDAPETNKMRKAMQIAVRRNAKSQERLIILLRGQYAASA